MLVTIIQTAVKVKRVKLENETNQILNVFQPDRLPLLLCTACQPTSWYSPAHHNHYVLCKFIVMIFKICSDLSLIKHTVLVHLITVTTCKASIRSAHTWDYIKYKHRNAKAYRYYWKTNRVCWSIVRVIIKWHPAWSSLQMNTNYFNVYSNQNISPRKTTAASMF